ncbi:Glutamate 5-kinase [Paracidovorax citrulli]|nr:Glutamate 5-kinase [Paracidovorax citrulli]
MVSSILRDARRIVIKVGSSLVTNEGRGLDETAITEWSRQMAALVNGSGGPRREVIMVSSGAIAEGMKRLGWSARPSEIHELQAAAAVGQMGLAQMYETKLREQGLGSAQVLLTHADLADRERYLNARSTLLTLLRLGVVPVINENDTVVTDEIKFGDNDTLGALVANLVEADALVILTDQKGLYTADPRRDPHAQFVHEAAAGDPSLEAMAGGVGTSIGRGGMITKIIAARRAAGSGASTVIAWGREPDVLLRLTQGEAIGTLLVAQTAKKQARKQWMADRPPAARRRDGGCRRGGQAAAGRKEPPADRHGCGGGRVLPGRRDRRARRGGSGNRPRARELRQRRGAAAVPPAVFGIRAAAGLQRRTGNGAP